MIFGTIVGQSVLTTTLKNAVKSGKPAHVYLFCGPRGVGKTTCTRISARAINCLNPTADGEACNEYESYQTFNEQRLYDIFEFDTASSNSMGSIKSLMDQMRIPPQVDKYKILVIDEVHMLSASAFNVFLKTLEEPSACIIFILATIEKHGILPTIISCRQIYDFERMATTDIISHLESVAQQEGITYEDVALNTITEKADGGVRDALSVFDQTASLYQGNITYNRVLKDLNVLDADNYSRMVDLSLGNKVGSAMVLLNSTLTEGFNGGLFTNGLASYICNVFVTRDARTLFLLEVSKQQQQKYQQRAQKCPTKFLYQVPKALNRYDMNYRQNSSRRLLVELMLIEVVQATQAGDASDGAGRSSRRLKLSLKKLAPAMGGETNQRVASSETSRVSPASARHAPVTSAQRPSIPTPAATDKSADQRPWLTFSDIGMIFNDLRNGGKKSSYQAKPEQQVTTQNTTFSEQELVIQWKTTCSQMPQEKISLTQRMKNLTPRIATFPNIEAVIDNGILFKQLQDDKGNILTGIRTLLKNAQSNINLRPTEARGVTKIYSKREIFKILKNRNPQFSELYQSLKLQLG